MKVLILIALVFVAAYATADPEIAPIIARMEKSKYG
jgi:hypothetical protein